LGERRVTLAREGTTAYLKVGYRAPAITDADFFPLLVLDAVLTGAKGLNIWSSFRTPPPQRSARLYQALVDTGLASAVNGGLVPTEHPFLYTISITAADGASPERLETVTLAEIDRVRTGGITPAELVKVKNQLRARMVFEGDSIANVAHQLGFFETIADWRIYESLGPRIAAVTLDDVARAAAERLAPASRTIGWLHP
jgi:zinc protease